MNNPGSGLSILETLLGVTLAAIALFGLVFVLALAVHLGWNAVG